MPTGASSSKSLLGIGESSTSQSVTNQQAAIGNNASGQALSGSHRGNAPQAGQGSLAATVNYRPTFNLKPAKPAPGKPTAVTSGSGNVSNSTGNPGTNIDASVRVTNYDPAAAITALEVNNNISLASIAALHDVSIATLANNQYAANLAAGIAAQSLSNAGNAERGVIEIAGQAAPVSSGNQEQNTQTNYNAVIIVTAVISAIVGIAALYLNHK